MMPMVQSAVSEFFGIHAESTINPYEVVAMGAALKGAELDQRLPVRVRDIVSHALSFETTNDFAHVIIPRGTALPFESKPVTITNANDNQERISLNFFEGDSVRASRNAALTRQFRMIELGPARSTKMEIVARCLLSGRIEIEVDGELVYPDPFELAPESDAQQEAAP